MINNQIIKISNKELAKNNKLHQILQILKSSIQKIKPDQHKINLTKIKQQLQMRNKLIIYKINLKNNLSLSKKVIFFFF